MTTGSTVELQRPQSLLERQAVFVIPFTLGLYVILQGAIGLHNHYSSAPICHETLKLPMWVEVINFATATSLCTNGVLQLYFACKALYYRDTSKRPLLIMHLSILTIHVISSSSMYLTYFLNYGGLCRDTFG